MCKSSVITYKRLGKDKKKKVYPEKIRAMFQMMVSDHLTQQTFLVLKVGFTVCMLKSTTKRLKITSEGRSVSHFMNSYPCKVQPKDNTY